MVAERWAKALVAAGTPEHVISKWRALVAAVAEHQRLLTLDGIGMNVSERDRVRVNARRVGLEAPLFADEAAQIFAAQKEEKVSGTKDMDSVADEKFDLQELLGKTRRNKQE